MPISANPWIVPIKLHGSKISFILNNACWIYIYFKKVKDIDGILEDPWWNIVLRTLNDISKDCATELQQEGIVKYEKPDHEMRFEEAPPMRLLALTNILSTWLGWVMNEKQGHTYSWQKIEEAYRFGRELSIDKLVPWLSTSGFN